MTAMTLAQLTAALPAQGWLAGALDRVAAEPSAIAALLPAAGRRVGRVPLPRTASESASESDADIWRTDDAARVLLLAALPLRGVELAGELTLLYRHGDADEKRAVLRALPLLPVGDSCVDLLRDALRTNDTRLVAAALGPYAAHLDDAAWRQGVLKCVFMGLPLAVVAELDTRADGELFTMLDGLARERQAAGRTMAADATDLLHRLTPGKAS